MNQKSKTKISISWSGGKDSILALDRIIRSGEYKIHHLHTVIDADLRRVGLHGVPEYLIEKQADALGIPLKKLYLKKDDSHKTYDRLMHNYIQNLKNDGITYVMFGDIFLEDLKAYRDKKLESMGLTGVYPLWQEKSLNLIHEFLERGYKTCVCAADSQHFSEQQLGKTITPDWINSIPKDVDLCGENGEFHTFVYNGPLFNKPVEYALGDVVEKSYVFKIQEADGSLIEKTSTFYFQGLR